MGGFFSPRTAWHSLPVMSDTGNGEDQPNAGGRQPGRTGSFPDGDLGTSCRHEYEREKPVALTSGRRILKDHPFITEPGGGQYFGDITRAESMSAAQPPKNRL